MQLKLRLEAIYEFTEANAEAYEGLELDVSHKEDIKEREAYFYKAQFEDQFLQFKRGQRHSGGDGQF